MQIVSGPPQRLQIHYEALPAERIEYEMVNFLNFINKSSDNPYIKSAIAHLWFAIVRLMMTAMDAGRALAHFYLSDSGIKIYSISSVIYENKKVIIKF